MVRQKNPYTCEPDKRGINLQKICEDAWRHWYARVKHPVHDYN